MTKDITHAILIFVLSGVGLYPQHEKGPDYYLCQANDLPTSVPTDALKSTITNHTFISSVLKDSPGIITFWNRFRSPIVAFEMVVGYTDSDDNELATATYAAMLPKVKTQFQLLVPAEHIEPLKRAIPVGGNIRIISEGFVIMRQCPTKASVLAAKIMFADGGTQTWTEHAWAVDPLLESFPTNLNLPFDEVQIPSSSLVRIKITAEGKVEDAQLIDGNSSAAVRDLRQALSSWHFYPAQRNGEPAPSELTLLIRFNAIGSSEREIPWIEAKDVNTPLVVVDLIPSFESPKWSVWYGRRPGDTE
jgi:hypothetical protein